MVRLTTASFFNRRVAEMDLVRVRISLGYPRHGFGHIDTCVRELMPSGLLHLQEPEYLIEYRARLEAVGLDTLREIFEGISAERGGAGSGTVVL